MKKVYVAMSGGVDSSVAAALLLERGYDVVGIYMKCWDGLQTPDGIRFQSQCQWKEERRDAMRVAAKLGIPFTTFDYVEEYARDVIEDFFREYSAGRTPNPDILCNRDIKFGVFFQQAMRDGADAVATGHYARSVNGALLRGVDSGKDQSYFLWTLNHEQLQHVMFPVGELLKRDVRAIAATHGLPVAEKKDSQGICFVGEVPVDEFLRARIPERVGKVITASGKVIGEHRGVAFYTIGQRHGLRIPSGLPYYVAEKDVATNTITVAEGQGDDVLYRATVRVSGTSWVNEQPEAGVTYGAKLRYRQPDQPSRVAAIDGRSATIVFLEPQRAVTPGQSLVLYDGDRVIGGGVIQ